MGSLRTARRGAGVGARRGSQASVRVAQFMSGFVSVSQLRPRIASHAESRVVIKKRVETRGVPSRLDSVKIQKWVIALVFASPSNRQSEIGWSSLKLWILFLATNLGETKQSEAPELRSTRMADEYDRRFRMQEFLSGIPASVQNGLERQS